MNVGMDIATGEYIGIVEPDDYIKPEMYETLYKIAKDNNVEIIKGDYWRFKTNDGSEKKELCLMDCNQKIDDIKKYQADVFVMGDDWEGKFDFLKDYCEVVYLPRTPDVSSTQTKEYIITNHN